MRLFGKNPVNERLRCNPKSIRKISVQQGYNEMSYIRKKAKQWDLLLVVVPKSKMLKIGRNVNAQGIFIDIDEFPYMPYDEMLETALSKQRCLIFLDRLNDPQNLGAIIRSLACLGKFSIVLPTHESVSITEAVLRVSSGGDNYVHVAKVANLANAIKLAQKEGFWIAGAVVKDGQPLDESSLPYPMGLVIGSEQKGIRPIIRKQLDLELSIPMASETMSFNVAHATTLLCYEVTKQKKANKKK